MTTDVHTPKSYTCPKCDKHHAADLSAMEGHPEIHGKVHCMGCHVLLWISLGEDGATKCEIFEEHLHEAEEAQGASETAATEPAEQDAAPAAGTDAASAAPANSMLGTLLAAAVVAALVSFFVGKAAGGGAPAPDAGKPNTAAHEAMATRIDGLEDALAAARGAAGSDRDELENAHAALRVEIQANADGLTRAVALAAAPRDKPEVPAMQAHISAVEKLEGDIRALAGRIEGYYQSLRLALKRIEALEAK